MFASVRGILANFFAIPKTSTRFTFAMLVFTVLSIPSYVFFYYGNQSSTGEDQENPKFVLSKLSLGNIGACKIFINF